MQNFKQLLILTVGLATSTFSIAQTMQIAPSWTGLYNDEQKISLFFQQKGTDVSGYSLLNGKQTNFKGKIQQTDLNYTLTLNEVGQGADIGKFILEFKNNATPIEAQWLPISKSVKPKFFNLDAQQCKFAKGQGDFPETSTRLLKDGDLQVARGELEYMRNEIYARHGYAFKTKEWANTFAMYDWYMPCYTNVEGRLSKIERENVKRIKMVEPYAQKMDWGR
jgi:hypothetical protein